MMFTERAQMPSSRGLSLCFVTGRTAENHDNVKTPKLHKHVGCCQQLPLTEDSQ